MPDVFLQCFYLLVIRKNKYDLLTPTLGDKINFTLETKSKTCYDPGCTLRRVPCELYVTCSVDLIEPEYLFVEDKLIKEVLYSDLLKSNCLVKNKPVEAVYKLLTQESRPTKKDY